MKIIKKTLIMFILVLSLAIVVKPTVNASDEYNYPVQQFRAAWVSHFAGDVARYQNETQYKKMMTTVLDNMQSMGMNAIIYHVRTHNNAMYNSSMNPIASWWQDVNFDEFDPLTWLIEETHRRGMEFHAWMNPYRISSTGVDDLDALAATFPSNNIASDKSMYLSTSGGVILNPGEPAVRKFIVDTCMEVAEKYDIDAIHFDDYFYISGVDDTATRNKYNTKGLSLGDFRREQVDLFIEQLHDSLTEYNEKNNKFIQLGISPSGIYRNGSSYGDSTVPKYDANGNLISPIGSNTSGFAHYDNYLYSDTKKWIDNEWIDYILPQTYWAISHTNASFAKLTKWWSWCVKNKNVNLYMGHGIYMALGYNENTKPSSSYYYWSSPKEIENQLLDMTKYPEIDGSSMYKYASLISSNALAQAGAVTLKTLWNKQIPGAVIKSFKDTPAPKVENVVLNDGILSWNKLDNVRQYVVWRVNTNETLDTTNINHLYKCTTSNTIEVEKGYTYYVSSVNKANVISEAVGVKEDTSYDTVIRLISTIPSDLTIDDEGLVKNIRALYEELDDAAKLLVTNYEVLVNSEAKLVKLKALKEKATSFINTLNLHLKRDTLLPLSYEGCQVRWSYAANTNQSYYDLTTGKRLKNPLEKTFIDLILTIDDEDISYSQKVAFNVGVTASNETGLFYRNAAGAMSKDDDQNYTGGYIGASGRSLSFNGYRFFIASGNDFDITSNNLPAIHWSSCGVLYRNVSNSNITFKVNAENSAVNTTNGYGFFIVNKDGIVRYTTSTYDETETVTLAPGEYMYCVRYLDSLINGSVMKPATQIEVGTKVLLENYNEAEPTPDDKAQIIIDEINKIPSTITIKDEALIERVKALYDSATTEVKAKVTNYEKLVSAINTLDSLKKAEAELETLRNAAIEAINSVIADLSKYSDSGISIINNTISDAVAKIRSAVTAEEITSIKDAAITKLRSVKTAAEEDREKLPAAVKAAENELDNFVDITKYSDANKTLITNIINEAKQKFAAAVTCKEVESILANAKSSISGLKTLDEELKAKKTEVTIKLKNIVSLDDYSPENQKSITIILNNAYLDINAATTIIEVEEIYKTVNEALKAIPTKKEQEAEILKLKASSIKELKNSYDLNLYTVTNQEVIKALVDKYTLLINNSSTIAEIDKYKTEGLMKIASVEKDKETFLKFIEDTIKEIKEAIDYEKYDEASKTELAAIIENYENQIRAAQTERQINTLKEEALLEIKNIKTIEEKLALKKAEYKANLNDIYEKAEISESEREKVLAVLESGITKIDEAATEKAVDEAYSDAVDALNAAITGKPSNRELEEARKNAIEELNDYVSEDDYSEANYERVLKYINDATEEIEASEDLDEIKHILNNTKQKIDKVAKKGTSQPLNCAFIKMSYIYMLITLLGVALISLRRK